MAQRAYRRDSHGRFAGSGGGSMVTYGKAGGFANAAFRARTSATNQRASKSKSLGRGAFPLGSRRRALARLAARGAGTTAGRAFTGAALGLAVGAAASGATSRAQSRPPKMTGAKAAQRSAAMSMAAFKARQKGGTQVKVGFGNGPAKIPASFVNTQKRFPIQRRQALLRLK